ncbi:Plasmodium exported protein, unknown function [Plasmodium vivax]|uniref:Variable surface protein Vir35 n=1 Tax=Plasmodium vivax TaxID=5855 RepID=A0A564ZSY5_PLAVI|nr:Plasmodium exported protein, unknown function [Plasmodium vivax]
MELLGYYKIKKNVKFVVLFKLFTFLLLIWNQNNGVGHLDKSLEKKYKSDISLDMNFNRLLAKHDRQRELKYSRQGAQLANDIINKNTRNVLKDTPSYVQLSKKGKTGLDVYMNEYKRRYRKKKGLSKLECYCEKKVLDKLHGLYAAGEKLKNEKKSLKNFFLKKYGIGLILFALMPAVSLIYYILFGAGSWWDAIIKFCGTASHISDETLSGCQNRHEYKWKPYIDYIHPALMVFTFTMIIIILLFVFYTLIKVVKYEKLKSGKDKMSLKEYLRFSKDVFI